MARFLVLVLSMVVTSGFAARLNARELGKLYDKEKFKIGNALFEAYVADNDQRRAQGLMFVEKIDPDLGMLFVFEEEKIQGFWMKNTLIPLNIGFFDAKGKLVDVQEMQVAKSLVSNDIPTYESRAPALYALEMNRGWFEKHKIKKGAQLELRSQSRSPVLRKQLRMSK